MQIERPIDTTKVLQEIQGPSSEEQAFRKSVQAQSDQEYFDRQDKAMKEKYPAITKTVEDAKKKVKKNSKRK